MPNSKIKLHTKSLVIVVLGLVIAAAFTTYSFSPAKASAQEPADINSDNKVDIFDLSTLLSNWNKPGVSTSDLNSDSTVNIFDLSMLLSKWGPVQAVAESNMARVTNPAVTVTASSEDIAAGQGADNTVDGSLLGYPVDDFGEWSTVSGGAGSWLQLTWASPVTLSRVVLHDRPNTDDQITGGNLIFSDGSSVPVPSLNNAGLATTVTFTSRAVTSVRLNITSVSGLTQNIGLAEIQAWGYAGWSGNMAPTANAGTGQFVTPGTLVTLDGSGSSDPDNNSLTYVWSQTSGSAVTLSSTTATKPTFTATVAGTYVFSLVVNDGTVNSSASSVSVIAGAGASASPMELISRSKPAFASSGTASNANDANYNTSWSPSGSGWLAYDLSSVSVANRSSVVLAWYTSQDDGYTVNSYQGLCPAWSGRPYISNYTIEVNSAAGGGSAPASGWVTAATVTGNGNLAGQHLVNFSGYNWIRINGSGPNGIDVNVDVADASSGVTDGWIFFGDSITATYAGHSSVTDPSSNVIKSVTDLVEAGTSGIFAPIQQSAGMSCTRASDALVWIDGFLDNFQGKYVTLNFGANDNWAGSGDATAYYNNMVSLINKVKAKGKIPVIPKMTWPNNGGVWDSNTILFNTKIDQIYQNFPDVIHGPDLYTLTKNRPELFNGAGDVHPNEQGAALIRKAWADTMLANVYSQAPPAPTGAGIYVSGNKLVNGEGSTVTLHGVNKMGSEYACIDGWGFFDGPTDQASINAMKAWNINAVRVTLNSACWIGAPVQDQFATYNAAYAGVNYQNAIKNYVDLLVQNDIHPILDLQWAGCGTGTCVANWIKSMPDRPYANQFWSEVGATFKDNKSVLFDIYNEPQDTTWQCWRDGGCLAYEGSAMQYTTAGMQELVTAVRSAGATTQPIMLGGLQYSNDVSGWLANLPTDPNNGLVASVHLYNFNWPCPTNESGSGTGTAAQAITCFTSGYNDITAIKAAHPIVFGELGQDDCQTNFVNPMMDWMLANNMSMLGWSWNTYDCASNPSLITDYNGTPSTFGAAFRTFYTTKYPAWPGIK